jgi:hypothetical protein
MQLASNNIVSNTYGYALSISRQGTSAAAVTIPVIHKHSLPPPSLGGDGHPCTPMKEAPS